jgi:hypothetical protein
VWKKKKEKQTMTVDELRDLENDSERAENEYKEFGRDAKDKPDEADFLAGRQKDAAKQGAKSAEKAADERRLRGEAQDSDDVCSACDDYWHAADDYERASRL